MSDEKLNVESGPPTVALKRLDTLRSIEVLESDLDQLESAVAAVSQALGFLTFSAGSLIGAVLQWVSLEKTSDLQRVVFFVTIGVATLGCAWFGIELWRRSHGKTTLLARLKGTPTVGTEKES